MVDYSKWDNIDDSSDEEDFKGSRVTTLSDAGKVTIGPDGYRFGGEEQQISLSKLPAVSEAPAAPGDLVSVNPRTLNGGEVIADGHTYQWSQDRQAVQLTVFVPQQTKSKEIAIALNERELVIRIAGAVFLSETMQYAVLEEEELDWELLPSPQPIALQPQDSQEHGQKMLQMTFQKTSPIPGAVFWWRKVFIGDPEIDVGAITGRGDAGQQAARNYEEAHRLFREKVREQVEVDVGEES